MDTETAPRRPEPFAPAVPPRLMVVDDSAEARAIADYFVARGYEVQVATDGVQALAQTIMHGVDVIIMNASLPGLEGYEAAAILRKIHPDIQILLTMAAEVETRPREQQRTERFRCFPKPLDLAELAGVIEGAATGRAPDPERSAEDAG